MSMVSMDHYGGMNVPGRMTHLFDDGVIWDEEISEDVL